MCDGTNGAARIPQTSSLGRLFDAAAFLPGVCDHNRYEAKAAMALEAIAHQHLPIDPLKYSVSKMDAPSGLLLLDVLPMIREPVEGIKSGQSVPELARAFHETVAAMLAEAAN